MAKKKNIYGAGEATGSDVNPLVGLTPAGAFPISFGRGEFTDGVIKSIFAKDDNDNKARFVWNIDSTNSGAVFVGNKLVSSRVLNIYTDAEYYTTAEDANANGALVGDEKTPATEVTVTFIKEDGELSELQFGVVDPSLFSDLLEEVEKLKAWASQPIIVADEATPAKGTEGEADYVPATPGSPIKVTPQDLTETNEDGEETTTTLPYKGYKVDLAIDENTLTVTSDGKLAGMEIAMERLTDETGLDSDNYAAQYQLYGTLNGNKVKLGDTIDIFKDFLLKDAHVCTFNKNVDGTDYELAPDAELEIDTTAPEVYAVVTDPNYGTKVELEDGTKIYLEKAPVNKGLKIGHTYLHLILNTVDNDELNIGEENDHTPISSINDGFTDVYLDFTEIISQGAFGELEDKVDELDERVEKIEDSYISGVTITKPEVEGDAPAPQFSTVTVTSKTHELDENEPDGFKKDANGNKIVKEVAETFDIANENYYKAVNDNFVTLKENDELLAEALTWGDLD